MTRNEERVAWVLVFAFLLVFAFAAIQVTGVRVVECGKNRFSTATGPPAVQVRVFTTRRGHIVERHLFGSCSIFSYRGPVDTTD